LNLVFLLFFLSPFYWLTVTALKPPDEVYASPVRWLPSHLFWGYFQSLFTAFDIQRYLFNSLVVACISTSIALVLSIGAAYALAHLPLPAKRTLLLLIVLMVSIPSMALIPALYLELRDLGWLNTRRALVAPYVATSLPFAVWILTNAFRTIPRQLIQQAEVDGCTPLQALRCVVLPLASPTIVTAALVLFLTSWNEFLFAVMFILDAHADIQTLPVAVFDLGNSWGVVAAAAEVAILPVIVVVLLLQSRIVQGLSAGALKD
jgi:multiple sugar transport system permease protein